MLTSFIVIINIYFIPIFIHTDTQSSTGLPAHDDHTQIENTATTTGAPAPSEEDERLRQEEENRRIKQEAEERREIERADQERAQRLFIEEQNRQLEIAEQERRKQENAKQHEIDQARHKEDEEQRNLVRLAEERAHQEQLEYQRQLEQDRKEQERLDAERAEQERAYQEQIDEMRRINELEENERRENARREDERREHERREYERRNEIKPIVNDHTEKTGTWPIDDGTNRRKTEQGIDDYTERYDDTSLPTEDPYRSITDNDSDEFVTEHKCRSDNVAICKENRHVEICEVQLCDGVPDCPYGEDEHNCPESNLFNKQIFFVLIILFIYIFSRIFYILNSYFNMTKQNPINLS